VLSSEGHLSDGGRGGSAPGPQVCGDPVGGEQFPVGDQVGDDLGGSLACPRAAFAGHKAGLVEQVAPVGQPCLAAVAVNVGEAGDALGVQPVQEPGQLSQASGHGPQVQRVPVAGPQVVG